MQLFQAFTRTAGAVAVLLSSTALVQAADVSFLTHWAPDTVAKLEAATGKLQYDFYYIKHFSLWLDLLIVAKTLRTIATGFGAR